MSLVNLPPFIPTDAFTLQSALPTENVRADATAFTADFNASHSLPQNDLLFFVACSKVNPFTMTEPIVLSAALGRMVVRPVTLIDTLRLAPFGDFICVGNNFVGFIKIYPGVLEHFRARLSALRIKVH